MQFEMTACKALHGLRTVFKRSMHNPGIDMSASHACSIMLIHTHAHTARCTHTESGMLMTRMAVFLCLLIDLPAPGFAIKASQCTRVVVGGAAMLVLLMERTWHT